METKTVGYILKYYNDAGEKRELVIFAETIEHAEHLADVKFGVEPESIYEITRLK